LAVAQFFVDYGMFLAKSVTVLVVVLLIIGSLASASGRGKKGQDKGKIKVTNLNETFEEMEMILEHQILTKDQSKQLEKDKKQKQKEAKKAEKAAKKAAKKLSATEEPETEPGKKRIFVLDFDGDKSASGIEILGQEITAVLTMAREMDEIVLRLESPGGMVHSYGLAASQLKRIQDFKIPLTICVDKVAASGGYMMACVGDKILAAPFAVLGSVGVVAQLPNLHKVLKKNDVDYSIYTAGEYKRTVTILGENSEEGVKKFREELEETHILFKDMVATQRPALEMEKIGTGEHWYGTRALELGLIDGINTSDGYLFGLREDCDIYEVHYELKKSLADKLSFRLEGALSRSFSKFWREMTHGRNWI